LRSGAARGGSWSAAGRLRRRVVSPWPTACAPPPRSWLSTSHETLPSPRHAARCHRGAEPVHALQPVLRHLGNGARVPRRVLPGERSEERRVGKSVDRGGGRVVVIV